MLCIEDALEVRNILDKASKKAEAMKEDFLSYLIGMAKQECHEILIKHEYQELLNKSKDAPFNGSTRPSA